MGSKSGLESCGAIAHKYTYIVDDFCHLKHIPFSFSVHLLPLSDHCQSHVVFNPSS